MHARMLVFRRPGDDRGRGAALRSGLPQQGYLPGLALNDDQWTHCVSPAWKRGAAKGEHARSYLEVSQALIIKVI